MLTKEVKNEAIGLLSIGTDIEVVAEKFSLPLALIEEWKNGIANAELVKANAVLSAVDMIAKTPYCEDLKPKIKTQLQKTALSVVEKIEFALFTNDVVAAQMSKLAADAISKLYASIIKDDDKPTLPDLDISEDKVSVFERIGKD